MKTIVGVDNIQFWADNEIVDADDTEGMRRADAVSVTFRQQKNRDNGVVVTQHRTDKTGAGRTCHQDTELCIGQDSRHNKRRHQCFGVSGRQQAEGNLVVRGV